MDIGVGIYDVLNDPDNKVDTRVDNHLPQSTEQIVNIKSD